MVTFRVLVAVFQFLRRGMHEFDVVGRSKLGRGRRATLKASQGRLNEPGLPTLGAVEHFQNKVGPALIDDYATFANFRW